MVSWPEQAGEDRLKYNAQLRERYADPEGRAALTEQEVGRAEVLLARDKKKKKGKADLKRRIEEKHATKAARLARNAEAAEEAKDAPPAEAKPVVVRVKSSGRGGSSAGRGGSSFNRGGSSSGVRGRGSGRAAVDRGGRRSRGKGDKRQAHSEHSTFGKQKGSGVTKPGKA
jgi:hypothetical protein